MLGLRLEEPIGILKDDWSRTVEDYALFGAWACRGAVFVVGDAAGGIFAFEGTSGDLVWACRDAHEGGVLSMAVHPDTMTVTTAGQDGRILFWNAQDGQQRRTVELGRGWIENLAWSSNGEYLAASISRQVHVYTSNGDEVWKSAEHPSTVSAIAWSQNRELATACYGEVSFFRGVNGQLQQRLQWKGSLVSMVLSPNGDIVACGSQDNSVHFWRRSTGEDSMMAGYRGKPSSIAFDDTGTLLATGGGEAITVWSFDKDGPEGTTPGVLEGHSESVTSLVFGPQLPILASGARDGSVVLWSMRRDGQGEAVGAACLKDLVAGVVWRPDGKGLIALDAQGGVTSWRVEY